MQQVACRVEAGSRVGPELDWIGQNDLKQIVVARRVDPPVDRGVKRDRRCGRDGVAVVARHGGVRRRPGTVAVGVHRPNLDVVAGAVAEARDDVLERAPASHPGQGPVLIRLVGRAGEDVANVVGGDGRTAGLDRRAPVHGQGDGSDGDRTDGGSPERLLAAGPLLHHEEAERGAGRQQERGQPPPRSPRSSRPREAGCHVPPGEHCSQPFVESPSNMELDWYNFC